MTSLKFASKQEKLHTTLQTKRVHSPLRMCNVAMKQIQHVATDAVFTDLQIFLVTLQIEADITLWKVIIISNHYQTMGYSIKIGSKQWKLSGHLIGRSSVSMCPNEMTMKHTTLIISCIMYSSPRKTKSTGSVTLSDFNSEDKNQRCAMSFATSSLNAASVIGKLANTSE